MIHKSKGFTLVEIMIVVAIIGILIAIAIPSFFRAREVSRSRACQSNLVQIDGAKQQYGTENNVAFDHGVTWAELTEAPEDAPEGHVYLRNIPVCPVAGDTPGYELGNLNEMPSCDVDGTDQYSATGTYPHVHPSLIGEGDGDEPTT